MSPKNGFRYSDFRLMDTIHLAGLRCYSNHGCLDEESIIGSEYVLDLAIKADIVRASETDDLTLTVDYVDLYRIAQLEIKIRSKLIEHVAKRIIDSIFLELELVQEIDLELKKINPPINGDVSHVSIQMHRKRTMN